MSESRTHRLPGVPFKPNPDIENAWDTWCYCGWSATCDSLEAAVIGTARHLEDTVSEGWNCLGWDGPSPGLAGTTITDHVWIGILDHPDDPECSDCGAMKWEHEDIA